MSDTHIKIEYTALENLNPYKGNPKVHDEKQIQQIAKSIERFGFNNPILIDEKSEVIAGHGRLFSQIIACFSHFLFAIIKTPLYSRNRK